jgi:hypothetical protein
MLMTSSEKIAIGKEEPKNCQFSKIRSSNLSNLNVRKYKLEIGTNMSIGGETVFSDAATAFTGRTNVEKNLAKLDNNRARDLEKTKEELEEIVK